MAQKTALVTGATGFLGRQVFQAFKSAGWSTTGTGFSRADPPSILRADLSDEQAVQSLLEQVKYAATLYHQ